MISGRARKRIYAVVSAITAALTVTGCGACNLVDDSSMNATPNPANAGEQVTVETTFKMRSGEPVEVEFDLDGDGSFETKAAPKRLSPPSRWHATAQRSYASAQTIQVRAIVHAFARSHSIAEALFHGKAVPIEINEYHVVRPVTLQVQQGPNQPPLASFTVTPNPVAPEGQVTYDASASMDPDGGQIVRYEWDLDGNGTYELDTGASPTATQMESTNGFGPYPAQYTAGLRVTDGLGETGTTTRVVTVEHPPPRLAPATKLTRRLTAAETLEVVPRMRQVDAGQLQVNGDELLVQDRIDRGRIPADPFPAKLRRGKRKVRWLSTTDVVIDSAAGGSGNARGFALLRFPAGGRACMAYRVDSPRNGKPGGSLRILGGVGRAKGLRGRGTGEAKLTRDGIVIDGRFDVAFGGKGSFQLGKSGCAPLLD
jgi:hypothetical protein